MILSIGGVSISKNVRESLAWALMDARAADAVAPAIVPAIVLNKPLIEEFKARMVRDKLQFGRSKTLDVDVFIQRFINARDKEKDAKEASWKMLANTLKVCRNRRNDGVCCD